MPGEHFNTVLYTGDGSSKAITGVGFQPDFTWIKNTDVLVDHILVDAVRGATKYLVSNDTDVEVTNSAYVASLDSDGFTVGTSNSSDTKVYVGWNWKGDGVAGGTTNNEGETTSQVNANTTAGFSIFTYTGKAGSNAQTMGHGLTQAPEFVIVKDRDAGGSWFAGSDHSGWTDKLRLNSSDARVTATTWNDTAPTATIVTVGAVNVATEGVDYVAYCWHSVEGYSKVGSYVGNSSTNGSFVYTGFKPAYIMIKCYTAAGHWNISDSVQDPDNAVMEYIYANSTDVNTPYANWDFLSNGFKLRNTDSYWNDSGKSYLYYAVAESPFKTSNAR